MIRESLLELSLILLFAIPTFAQADANSDLFLNLKAQDSIFFELGFNQCDLAYLKSHVSEDLNFYHDQSGYQDRKTFLENTRKYICSDSGQKPIRKVIPSSLEVFPLYDNGALYAAIQKGIHEFYLREDGKEDVKTNIAKFTHVWILENDVWKLSEVLSYDHQDPSIENLKIGIEQLLKKNNVPALGLGVIENGKLTKVEVYGTLDKQTKAAYNSIFKVASLTKPIVAIVTLKLIDKGLLELDEPLHQYWIDPDIKDDDRHTKLTPKNILTHQTGFPNWRYLSGDGKLSFEFEPGTKFQYSGEGFEYLRIAIENKFDESIEELATKLLFEPLEMSETRFWWDAEMEESRYAQNFDASGKKIETVKYYEANAAANLLTTVEDYGRFIEYVINGAGLSSDLYQEMVKYQIEIAENVFFGLGWQILTGFSDDEFALMHTGKDPGVSTLAIWFPESKNGYLVFLNGDNVDAIYQDLLTNRLYLGDELWGMR